MLVPMGAATDIKSILDTFLLAAHRRSEAIQHEKGIPLAELAREVSISDGLAEKVATFLESEGLVDYDDQAIDITVLGMLRAEALVRRRAEGVEEELPRPEPRPRREP